VVHPVSPASFVSGCIVRPTAERVPLCGLRCNSGRPFAIVELPRHFAEPATVLRASVSLGSVQPRHSRLAIVWSCSCCARLCDLPRSNLSVVRGSGQRLRYLSYTMSLCGSRASAGDVKEYARPWRLLCSRLRGMVFKLVPAASWR